MDNAQIQDHLRSNYQSILIHLKGKDSIALDRSIQDKWSLAENSIHLLKSVAPLNAALMLPKFSLRMFGTAKMSGTYDEVVRRYQNALQSGAVATGPYVPLIKGPSDADQLMDKLTRHHEKLIKLIDKWEESELDKYRLPHPILGKLTVREMLYFTIYHISHHNKMMAIYS